MIYRQVFKVFKNNGLAFIRNVLSFAVCRYNRIRKISHLQSVFAFAVKTEIPNFQAVTQTFNADCRIFKIGSRKTGHVFNNQIFYSSASVREFVLLEKRCSAISCTGLLYVELLLHIETSPQRVLLSNSNIRINSHKLLLKSLQMKSKLKSVGQR